MELDHKNTETRSANLAKEMWAAIGALPGVRGATFSWGGGGLLTGYGRWHESFSVDGYVPGTAEPAPSASAVFVGPNFLQTLGIPLLRGRELGFADVFPAESKDQKFVPRVVINESLARKFFGATDPIGRKITLAPVSYTIVGVAKDTKEDDFRDNGAFEIYLPCVATALIPETLPPVAVMLEMRTSGNPELAIAGIRKAIRIVDPSVRSATVATVDDGIDAAMFQERMIAEMAGLFSAFALLLASLGLYGVLAYNVSQRTREIGVRMALGAQAGSIISLVLWRGMALTAIGCAVGMVAAMSLAHVIANRLYGVPAIDPLTFLLAPLVLLTVALVACWLPARRASKVDPLVALRAE